MKKLLKKLKKINKYEKIMYLLSIILYIIGYIYLTYNLIHLKGIETIIRIVIISICGIYLLFYILKNLINMLLKKHFKYHLLLIITFIFISVFFVGFYYIDIIYSRLTNITEKKTTTYTTYLISLKDYEFNSDSSLGIIDSENSIEGNILAYKLIENKNLKNDIEKFEDFPSMITSLYNKEVDAIFVSSNYVTLFESDFKNIGSETKVVYEYSENRKNEDTDIISNKKLTEPFSVLILGVDSTIDGLNANAAFNGDTLMLVTFNPNTLVASMFSIPRDTFVPIACKNNQYAKINSSAAYGTKCVIDTVEKFVGFDIDYYVKINFKGVVALVEALDGVSVDVDKDFCEQDSNRLKTEGPLICLKKGYQHLNGEEALAYARHRKTYSNGDISRIQNQQQIVEAIAKKLLSSKAITNFEDILNSISNNIATNMETNDILSLYNVLKKMLTNALNDEEFININKTYLEYYYMEVYRLNTRSYTSAVGHYPSSLKEITNMMKANLELEKFNLNKTFSYELGTSYEKKVYGRDLKTGNKLELLPDFTGKTIEFVRSYCNKNNIKLTTTYVDSDNKFFNNNVNKDLVGNQSVHKDVFINLVDKLTIYVNNSNPIKEIETLTEPLE